MAESQATIGYRTTLEIALASDPSVWTYIAETKSHKPPSFSDSPVEVTHMQSPRRMREYTAGLVEPGSSEHELNYVPGSPTDIFLESIAGKKLIARLTFTNGRQMIYSAVREGYDRDVPMDSGNTGSLTLKVSGAPTMTGVAAPRNLILPTITGIPKVGAPLVLDEGVWAGAEDITYQWRKSGTAIVGATQSSYVPVVADVGAPITVTVTGANGSFSTSAVSAATANVAA